jgi:cytochrome c peroxidase
MKSTLFFLAFTCATVFLTSCVHEEIYYTKEQKAKLTQLNLGLSDPYEVKLPQYLLSTGLFARPIDDHKARLGRVIFYDKSLSSDGKISCASCHLQDHGFADKTPLSKGVNDRQSARNSIALSSVVNFSAYYGTDLNGPTAIRFFWDNSAETIEQQSRGAFTNPDEMNMHMDEIVSKMKSPNLEYYGPLFQKAFNPLDDNISDAPITEARVFEAMSHFINSMGSFKSDFDKGADQLYASNQNTFSGVDLLLNTGSNNFNGWSASQEAGKDLYMTNCASCHSANMGRPILQFGNNGLDAQVTDPGVGGFTNNPNELGQFKVPTLRNIEVSGPYMHDGRFATLEDVVDHYSTGIKDATGLHQFLRQPNGQPRNMNFTPDQKRDLVAFLKTLTDQSVQTDERFSNPFKQ